MQYLINALQAVDWEQVRAIYLQGIATGNATFETTAPPWKQWDGGHLPHSRLVARDESAILGWATLSPVSKRHVYRGVAEVSVYVHVQSQGRGIGRALLQALIGAAEHNGIWTLQAGIFPETTASIRLHLRCGFREVGRREHIGKRGGVWCDTLLLERRSDVVGT